MCALRICLGTTSRMKAVFLFFAGLLHVGCNDLTAPLPAIAGSYQYVATSTVSARHKRIGTIRIFDDDPLSARFDGSYSFTNGYGELISGQLVGAFITRDSIWFRFVDDRLEYHEANLTNNTGAGEIFFLTETYRSSGTHFTLRR